MKFYSNVSTSWLLVTFALTVLSSTFKPTLARIGVQVNNKKEEEEKVLRDLKEDTVFLDPPTNGEDEDTERSLGWCRDSPGGWYDSDGPRYNCVWYSHSNHCSWYGYWYSNFGKTAVEACCTCGGGIKYLDDDEGVSGNGYGGNGGFGGR